MKQFLLYYLKILLFGLLLFLAQGISNLAFGQTNGDYRSRQSGNWNQSSSWQVYNNGWVNASNTPNNTSGIITIRNGHTITVTNSPTVDQVVVEAGGQVTINVGQTFTIANGASTDMTVNGTVVNSGVIIPTGSLVFNSGSVYQHAQNGGTIPTATWDANSNCSITGLTSTAPTGLNQTFGNFIMNSTRTTWAHLSPTSMVINGNLEIQKTDNNNGNSYDFAIEQDMTIGGDLIISGGAYRISYNTNRTQSVTGNLVVNNGSLLLNTSGSGTSVGTLNVGGDVSISGGTLNLSGGNATGQNGILNVKGSFSQTGGSITETGSATGCQINFTGTSIQTYSKAGGTIANIINFSVASGATLDVGTSVINGSTGTFTLNSGAGIITAHAQGLSTTAGTGSIQVTGVKAYNTAANCTYDGTVAQVTGNGLTGANNLTINNSAGVTLSASTALNNTGTLNLVAGVLTTGTYTLTVNNNSTSAVTGGSSSSFINGSLVWTLAPGSTYAFPVGKGTTTSDYYPFGLAGITGTTPQIKVEAFKGNSGGTASSPLSSLSNTEYWLSSIVSGTYSNGSVSLTRQTSLSNLNAIGRSSTQNGAYSSLNGTVSGTSIINSDNTGNSLGYFVMAAKNTITTSSITPTTYCAGASISVPFTVIGTYIGANVFTAQLSDASGSFSSPTAIGALTQTTAGTISAIIPTGTAYGTGYRIRVVSSSPAIIGSDNGTDLTVYANFTAGAIPSTGATICYGGDPGVIGSTTVASGGDGSITYKWQANGVDIASSNSATYDPPTGLTTNTTYTRWAKDNTCNTTFTQSTGSWVVTVRPNFTAGAIPITGATICYNGDPGVIGSTTAASGGDNSITYKWQANSVDIASSNSVTYDPPTGLTTNTTYTRWAKDNTCNTTFTQSTGSWVVTVRPNFTAGAIQTTGATICYGGDPGEIGSSTVASGGDNNITYKWQANGVDISSSNSATYDPPTGLTTNTTYTRWVKDNTCNTTFTQSTGSWLVTVRPNFTAGAILTTGATICYNGDPGVVGSTTAASGGDNSITYKWQANGVDIASSNSATYDPPTGLTTNTTYTRWAKDNTCNTTFTQSTGSWLVTVQGNFTAGTIQSTGATICYNGDPGVIGSATAASGGDNSIAYKWQANGVDISSSNSATYDPPTGLTTNTTYTRWAKDNTCNTTFTQSTGSWLVTVRSNFTAGAIQATGATICYNGDPGVIGSTTAASGGDNSITYKWQANGVDIVSSNSATYDPPTGLTTNTTYTRWAKDNTCNTTFTQSTGAWTVTINPLPTPSFTVQPGASACIGVGVTYTTQTGQSNYVWTYTGVSGTDYSIISGGGNTNTVTLKWLTVGSKTVTINYTNGNGCTAASPVSSTPTNVNSLPNNSSTGFAGNTICAGDNGTLTFDALDASFVAPYTVAYTDGTTTWNQAIPNASPYPFNVPVNPVTTTTYTLVSITNGNGCITTSGFQDATAQITVRALPTASISGATAVCLNAASPNITFTGAGGTAPYTFTYNINGGGNLTVTTTSGSSVTVAVPTSTAGSFVYNLVSVKDGNSTTCSQLQSGSASITVNPLPIIYTLTGSSICASSPNTGTITLSNSESGVSYQLKDGSNNNVQSAKNGTTGSPLTWTGLASGNGYYVVATGASPTNCSSQTSAVNISSVTNPTVYTLTGSSICALSPNTGTITLSNSESGVSYQLKDSSNNNVQSAKNGTTGSPLTWNGLPAGNGYYVVATGTSPTNCPSQTTTADVSASLSPTASITQSTPTNICQNGTAYITGASASNGTILWTHNGSGSLSGATTLSPTYTAVAADGGKTVTLTMTVSNSPCPQAKAYYTIIISSADDVPITIGPAMAPICIGGTSAPLGASIGSGATTVLWTSSAEGAFSPTASDLNATWKPPVMFSGTATLTLTVTNSCGSNFSSKTIVVQSFPTVDRGSAMAAICQGSTTATLGGSVGGSATGGIWTSSAGGTFSPTATNVADATWTPPAGYFGTANLTLTTSGSACAPVSDAKTVVVDQKPVITTQPVDQLDCEGAFVNFKAVATLGTYTWQRKKPTDADFITIPTELNVTYPTPGTIRLQNVGNSDAPSGTKYRVIVSNGSCSIISNTATLTVNEITGVIPSVASTSVTDVTICNGTNFNYQVTTSIPANVVSYQWKKWNNPGQWDNVSNGGVISGATTSQLTFTGATPSESGKYEVTVVFHSSGADCNVTSDTRTRILTVLSPMAAPVVSSVQTICSGSTPASLTATAATGGSGSTYSYTWQSSTDNSTWNVIPGATALTYQPPILSASTYYRVVATDTGTYACGSATSASILITVKPLPTATIAGTTAVCQNSASPAITFTGANGTSPYTFAYKINGGATQSVTTSSGNSVTVLAPTSTAGTFAYSLVSVQDASVAACVQAQAGTATITVNALPTATIGGTATVCLNSTSSSITFTGSNGISPYTFTYKINGGATQSVTTVSGNSVTVPVSTSYVGTYVYTLLSVQDSSPTTCFQVQSGTATVTVNPIPTATIAGTTAVCQNDLSPVVTFTGANGTSPYTFTYSINGGAPLVVTTSTGNTASVSVPTTTPGTFAYSLISVQDASTSACSQIQGGTATITVNPKLSATINYPGSPFCKSVSSVPVTLTGNTGGIFTSSPTGLTIDSSGTVYPGGSSPGTYTITYTLAAAGGCGAVTATATVTITAVPVATFSYIASPYCSNDVNPSPTFSGGGAAGVFSSTAGLVFVSTSTGQINLSASTAGTYTVTNTVAAAGGCSTAIATSSITITKAPVATFNYAGSPYCSSASNPVPTFTGGGVAGIFSSSVGLVFVSTSTGQINLGASVPGTYTVTNAIAAAGGCSQVTATSTITITSAPSATIGYSGTPFCKSIATAQSVTLTGTTGGTYSASPSGLTINSSTGAITPSTSTAGTYVVSYTLSSSGGCSGITATTTVIVTTPPIATFSYTGSPYCANATNPLPTFSGGGVAGTFSASPAGLVFVSTSTGEINISTSTPGTYTITNTIQASDGCSIVTASSSITINPRATISTDYCSPVAPKIRLTASGGGTYLWLPPLSGTSSYVDVDVVGSYGVTVTNGSCVETVYLNTSAELVNNGDFTDGNTGFTSGYTYKQDVAGLVPAGQGELYNDTGTNGYSITTNGQNVHINFWGADHTNNSTGARNFMVVNGHGTITVWQQNNIPVVAGTKYYFSAWAISMNNAGPFANLQFSIDGSTSGMTQVSTGVLPGRPENNTVATWTRFYGNWTAPTTKNISIAIVDLETALGGNDFGIDDISFGTLDPPAASLITVGGGQETQTVCVNTAITNIRYTTSKATGASVTGLPTGVAYTQPTGNVVTISGTPTVTGTFTYTLTLTGCGPNITKTGTITVTPNAAVTSVTGTNSQCVWSSTTYTANGVVLSGGTGTWSSSNPAVATVSSSGLVTALSAGTCTITYTITGGCGGTVSAQKSITINPNASIASVTGLSPLCIGNTSTYTANTVVLGGGTGSWTTSNSAIATVNSLGLVTAVSAGTCSITYTITGGCGGTVSATQAITVNPGSSITSVTGNSPICINSTTPFSVNAVLGSGTGAWSSSNATIATVNASGIVTGVASGTCTITYTITGGCSGTVSKSQAIIVQPNASIGSVTGTDQLCIGGTANYTVNSVVLSGGTASWTSSNPSIATVNSSGLVTGVSAGSCNIIYTITGGCGGVVSSQKSITISPNASIGSVTGISPLCIGSTATFTANSVVLSGGTGTWISSNTAVASVNPTTGVVTAISGGTTTITYSIAGGCTSASAAQLITVLGNPGATISGTTTVCLNTLGVNVTFTNPRSIIETIIYNVNGGPNQNINVNANSAATVLVPTTVAGTYVYNLVSAAYQSGVSCPMGLTGSATVTVAPIPSCSVSGSNTVFAGSAYTYTSTPVPADQVTHVWSITGNGTISGTTTSSTVNVVAGAPGTYTLRDDINRLGCTSFCTYTVTVISPCDISPVVGSVSNTTSTVFTAPAGMDIYSWSVSGNGSIPSGVTNSRTVTVLSGTGCTSYTVAVSLTKNGITSSCTQTVSVVDTTAPGYTVSPTTAEFCVINIQSAVMSSGTLQVTPAPASDYALFKHGTDTSLDLNMANATDNCCSSGLTIRWEIHFSSGQATVSGTGQPSTYSTDIQLWGDGTNNQILTHEIWYWIKDCNGNEMTSPIKRTINIQPRPKITTN
jgi:hypothetical protein